MRIIDLHCYPNTEPWIKSQGPYVEALAKYWNRAWTWKSEAAVIEEFKQAGVQALLVAFDIESVTGAPPCTNEYVATMRDNNPGVIRQAWGAIDPLKGAKAIEDAKKAIEELKLFGFHFHPIMKDKEPDYSLRSGEMADPADWDKAIKDLGPLAKNDEDLLLGVLFPMQAKEFLTLREGGSQK